MRLNLARAVPALITVLFPLVVYSLTLSPAVSFIDSGELAVVCYTLGISHPTGYPLYTLLGKIATWFPLSEVIVGLNFLSALFAAVATFIVFLCLKEIIYRIRP